MFINRNIFLPEETDFTQNVKYKIPMGFEAIPINTVAGTILVGWDIQPVIN